MSSPTSCPRCGAAAQGNFCAACGAPLASAPCAGCGVPLAPGARFCHKCGTPAGGATRTVTMAPTPSGPRSSTPWIVAGLLTVVAITAVVYAAKGRSAEAPDMANAGNAVAGSQPRAPDISNMTPKERFSRLADRVQTAIESQDTAQVGQFFPMVEGAWSQLPDTDRDVDVRYHMGILWAQVGEFDKALADADTMLTAAPNSLFAYYIRAMVGEFRSDSTAMQKARADFHAHYDAEIAKDRPEYKEHLPFLQSYRQSLGAK